MSTCQTTQGWHSLRLKTRVQWKRKWKQTAAFCQGAHFIRSRLRSRASCCFAQIGFSLLMLSSVVISITHRLHDVAWVSCLVRRPHKSNLCAPGAPQKVVPTQQTEKVKFGPPRCGACVRIQEVPVAWGFHTMSFVAPSVNNLDNQFHSEEMPWEDPSSAHRNVCKGASERLEPEQQNWDKLLKNPMPNAVLTPGYHDTELRVWTQNKNQVLTRGLWMGTFKLKPKG